MSHSDVRRCPLLAQSRLLGRLNQCPLLGVKRTSLKHGWMSANDPKRTSPGEICCDAQRQTFARIGSIGANGTRGEIIADEKVRKHLVAAGVIVKGSTAEEFGRLLADESERWNAVREAAGITRQ